MTSATDTDVDCASFTQSAERHRRELHIHCYRMLGSFEESEDLVQETFLRAWRGRDSFQGRGSRRAWLYKSPPMPVSTPSTSARAPSRGPVRSAGCSPIPTSCSTAAERELLERCVQFSETPDPLALKRRVAGRRRRQDLTRGASQTPLAALARA
jgi:hypothetical protein